LVVFGIMYHVVCVYRDVYNVLWLRLAIRTTAAPAKSSGHLNTPD